MADTSMRYLFMRLYGNAELCAYLTDMLQQGWAIDRSKGNFLFLRKRQIPNARLAVISTECTKRVAQGDEQVDESISIAKKQGWELLSIGDYESLVPVRRRLYFYTEDPAAKPLEPDAAIDFQYARRAYHTTLRWSVIWMLFTIVALMSTISFMLLDGLHFALVLIDVSLLALALSSICLCFNRRSFYRHVTKGTPLQKESRVQLRRWEICMTASLFALFAGLILLLFS